MGGPSPLKKILLIDADPEVRALIHELLDPAIWSVRHAADNKVALSMVDNAPFDLILTSAKTSGREDIELLRKIRLVRPHTRLIILTDESAPSSVIDSMREHAFSYFSRPFSLTALADMVHDAVEGPTWDDGIEVLSATPEWIRVLARCSIKTADRLIRFLTKLRNCRKTKATPLRRPFGRFCSTRWNIAGDSSRTSGWRFLTSAPATW